MSDSAGDIDDELLELAGATEKKRKKRQAPSSKSSASKRRKADVSSDPEDGPESEEDEPNPYPLEGKYVDEADREGLMRLIEVDREAVIAQRLEEMQRIIDKRNLNQMLNAQQNRNSELDSVSKAAKRQHTIKGATKEKSRKLDELKAKRKAKGEKKRVKANSPKRDRSSSPMDMETSSEEEEDGQITKFEEEEERDRKLLSKANPEDEAAMLEDLESCRLSRDMIAKFCLAPWFGEYVKGAWVRFLIGQEGNETIYRICEVISISNDLVKVYKVNDKMVNQQFELKHGKSSKAFQMDKVSNSAFLPKEWDRLVKVCGSESVKLPLKRTLEKKAAQMLKLTTQPMTESDINAMLARKNTMQSSIPQGQMTMERARLSQARTLALRRQDHAEVEKIDAELAQFATTSGVSNARISNEADLIDVMAKVNERNRRANVEAVRKSELLMSERKRKARMLAVSASGSPAPPDLGSRLRTVSRIFDSATPSRPGTPNVSGTPPSSAQQTTIRPASPQPSVLSKIVSSDKSKTLEAAVIESIEIDLGDF